MVNLYEKITYVKMQKFKRNLGYTKIIKKMLHKIKVNV